jgi:hypothetical protein
LTCANRARRKSLRRRDCGLEGSRCNPIGPIGSFRGGNGTQGGGCTHRKNNRRSLRAIEILPIQRFVQESWAGDPSGIPCRGCRERRERDGDVPESI